MSHATSAAPLAAESHAPVPLSLITATRGAGHYDVRTLAVDERPVLVSLRLGHDGVEYVGRLWFAHPDADERELVDGIPDRASIAGRTATDVLTRVTNLRPDEMLSRHARAMAERRRFRALREATEQVLTRIRYLNRVALLVRDGLLDSIGGEQEVDATVEQLHELVETLRAQAGREG